MLRLFAGFLAFIMALTLAFPAPALAAKKAAKKEPLCQNAMWAGNNSCYSKSYPEIPAAPAPVRSDRADEYVDSVIPYWVKRDYERYPGPLKKVDDAKTVLNLVKLIGLAVRALTPLP